MNSEVSPRTVERCIPPACRRVKRPSVLPHPNPLPLGEGTALARLDYLNARPAASDLGEPNHWTRILPLPAGEGRGEGDSVTRLPQSALSKMPSERNRA